MMRMRITRRWRVLGLLLAVGVLPGCEMTYRSEVAVGTEQTATPAVRDVERVSEDPAGGGPEVSVSGRSSFGVRF